MKETMIAVLCLVLLPVVSGQQQQAGMKKPSEPTSTLLEARVRKAWEDFKNRNKESFAALLAEGFTEVEEDGLGPRDAQAEIAEMDELVISQYTLKGFRVMPVGTEGALVTYIAEYSGNAGGQAVQEKDAMGEVWIKRGGNWKILYVQATKVK